MEFSLCEDELSVCGVESGDEVESEAQGGVIDDGTGPV